MRIHGCLIVIALVLVGCTQPPVPNLGVALKGIEESRFLACSGPRILELPQGGPGSHVICDQSEARFGDWYLEPDRPHTRFLFGGHRL